MELFLKVKENQGGITVLSVTGKAMYFKQVSLEDMIFGPPPAQMTVKEFKYMGETFLEPIQKLIDLMPDKGDTESTSQKICLQGALNNLERNITGVEDDDLKEEDDEKA